MTESDYWTAVGIMQTVWTNQPVPDETAKAWWRLGLFADLAAPDVEAPRPSARRRERKIVKALTVSIITGAPIGCSRVKVLQWRRSMRAPS
jgi:hypothetical protein